jgi:hypothetical protein
MIKRFYLVIRADKTARIITRTPLLREDEVAIVLKLKFPDTWGRVIDDLTLDVPEFAPTVDAEDEVP